MALLGASRVAVTPERSPPGASVAMPWAGSPGLRERPVVAMGKAGGREERERKRKGKEEGDYYIVD